MQSISHYLGILFCGAISFDNHEGNIKGLFEAAQPSSSIVPNILLTEKGYDISHRVEAFAKETGRPLTSIAMGSKEGTKLADAAITQSMKSGEWIILKNAHLALPWLEELEQRIETCRNPSSFKLFITSEVNPKIPRNLLRTSRISMHSPARGVRSSMSDSLDMITKLQLTPPPEKHRVYLLMAWLHAIVLERLRYTPLGWSKRYDFDDSDFEMGISLIDSWFSLACQGRSNIAPGSIPWIAIQKLVAGTVYGGKIDQQIDQALLNTLVMELFTEKAFNASFAVVPALQKYPALILPDGSGFAKFQKWVAVLDLDQSPHWIGLPSEANYLVNCSLGASLNEKLKRIEQPGSDMKANLATDSQHIKALAKQVTAWLKGLPKVHQFNPEGQDWKIEHR